VLSEFEPQTRASTAYATHQKFFEENLFDSFTKALNGEDISKNEEEFFKYLKKDEVERESVTKFFNSLKTLCGTVKENPNAKESVAISEAVKSFVTANDELQKDFEALDYIDFVISINSKTVAYKNYRRSAESKQFFAAKHPEQAYNYFSSDQAAKEFAKSLALALESSREIR
jgi:hypothetical protein